MNTQIESATTPAAVHRGPHPGMLAILYTVLFCAGLYPVTLFYKLPYWPGPWESASTIVPFFQTQGARVVLCEFLQLGAMVCLGLFTATVVSRLHFLGARAAGISIPAAFMKLLPKWLIVFGLILAAAGELSWFHLLVYPKLLFLIPLVRFPGFIWLIAVGFLLPKTRRPASI